MKLTKINKSKEKRWGEKNEITKKECLKVLVRAGTGIFFFCG